MKFGASLANFRWATETFYSVVIVTATVPAQLPILTAYNTQKNSVFLEWGSPLQTNGILIGYLLQYHLGMYLPSGISLLGLHFSSGCCIENSANPENLL